MNNTIRTHTSQQETQNNLILSRFLLKVESEISACKPVKHLLNEVIKLDSKYENVYASQTNLGIYGNARYCRETMNRAAKPLHLAGILYKITRFKKTCRYILNPLFKNPIVRSRLLHLLPALKYLPVCYFFTSSLMSLPKPNVTQRIVNINDSLFKVSSNTYTERLSNVNSLTTKKIVSDSNFHKGLEFLKSIGIRPPTNIMELKEKKEKEMLLLESNALNTQQVKQLDTQPISKAILAIKSLKLTKWGQIKLSIFTDYAISYADSVNLSAPAAPDPFENFFSIAQRVSLERKLPINTVTFMELARKYSMPQDAQYIIKAKPVEFAPSRNGEVVYSTESPTFQKTKAWTKPVREAHDPLKEIQTLDIWCSSQEGVDFKRKFGVDPARYLAVCAQNNAENWDSQAKAPVAEDLAYKERRRKSQEKLSERIRNAKELASNF